MYTVNVPIKQYNYRQNISAKCKRGISRLFYLSERAYISLQGELQLSGTISVAG